MGSIESGVPLKKNSLLRSSSSYNRTFSEKFNVFQPLISRLSRFLLFHKLDYLHWIFAVAFFLSFVVLYQMFLPGTIFAKSEFSLRGSFFVPKDLVYLKERIGSLDFGEDIQFEPSKLLYSFKKDANEANLASLRLNKTLQRFGYRKPQLALVFPDLLVDPQQLLMVTVGTALQEIGYTIQVLSLEDGPANDIWKSIGVSVSIIQNNGNVDCAVDWLNFDGILVTSLEARGVFSCLMQEPFESIPLIWTLHENSLAIHSRDYNSSGHAELYNDWRRVFSRATVVVFPNHVLTMFYSAFDAGNFYVIPSYPAGAWEADATIALYKDEIRINMGYEPDDVVIAVVGSQFFYRGLWLEHALVLQSLLPLLEESTFHNHSKSRLKINVLSGDAIGNYSVVVEAIASNLSYPSGVVKHIAVNGDVDYLVNTADIVIYGSFLEELSFPEILMKAMWLGKPIVAPDLAIIREYVDDRVNGFLFPKENIKILSQIVLQIVSNGRISPLALIVASIGKSTAKNLMVPETVEGYASLLENIVNLPSEVAIPKAVTEIPPVLKQEWRWYLFKPFLSSSHENRMLRSSKFLSKLEKQWNNTCEESPNTVREESFLYEIWEDEMNNEILNIKKKREDEELKDRTDRRHGTWDNVYKSARKAVHLKDDLHERDEKELERTGQPLCIYEPYFGEGTWPFLHLSSLYRGIGLSTKGRRPRTDDIDAPARLPILSNPYYRDALGEYGAFFAIASRIDRLHKNAWIGFQSWRATAGKASLSRVSEKALLDAIQTRRHGGALYFWVRMDTDPRNHLKQDFWSFCDALNAGNCRLAFSEALKRMYGVEHDLNTLPPMPRYGGTWSVALSWALPTRSFLEFVMFSRMFVDALDSQIYDEHYQSGYCYLSSTKDKHCYSRLLELLVNVWAYHSARVMVYLNPETGVMQEQHSLKNRKGKMWIKWFSYATLKSMDEDLAEEADSDDQKTRWLWPSTGEVVWRGVIEKEKDLRRKEKEKRKQLRKAKIDRMKKTYKQKALGKYVKPPPEDDFEKDDFENLNSTVLND